MSVHTEVILDKNKQKQTKQQPNILFILISPQDCEYEQLIWQY